MKYAPNIAGALLGFLFAAFSVMFLLKLIPEPPAPPEGSPIALFMGAFGPTGYLNFVKVFELLGGILVAIPRTRNFGLLVLGPIIVNILAFHIFVAGIETALNPILLLICALAAYLLWCGHKQFVGLLVPSKSKP
jgi:putative oxidoreductase